jgi:hypothetical protein
LKTRDLFAAIFNRQTGFEKPRADGKQRFEISAELVERVTTFDLAASTHEFVDAV